MEKNKVHIPIKSSEKIYFIYDRIINFVNLGLTASIYSYTSTVYHSLMACLRLCTFATKIRQGIMKTGKITATLKLKNDRPIEMT
jgi:hypothetical protein